MNLENIAMQDIIEYEKKLMEDRRQLQKLLNEYQGDSDEIIRDKLLFFQSELRHLNHQYELLKKKTAEKNVEPVSQPADASVASPITTSQEVEPVAMQSLPEPEESVLQEQPTQQIMEDFQREFPKEPPKEIKREPKKESKNLEKMVGSSLMGILASGLIFISLVLFATVILPSLGNAVKLLSCYAISSVLIVLSLIKLNKDKENKFYTALAGCGVGALYITLLLTNMYFAYIGDILLFILITIWVVFVCYLSKAKNPMFHIIGQLGVTISLIFGCVLCGSTGDFLKFISLTIFYVISFGTLYVTHFDKEVAYNKIGNIFGLINLSALFITNISIDEDIYYMFVLLIALAHLLILFLGRWENSWMSYGVFVALYGIQIACGLYGAFADYENGCGIAIYLVAVAILLAVEFKEKKQREGQIFTQIVMVVIAIAGLSLNNAFYDHGFVWLLVLPVILIGFLRKNTVLQFFGLVLTFEYLQFDISGVEKFFVALIVMIVLYVFMWCKRAEYIMGFKICLHLLGVVFLMTAGGDLLEVLIEARDVKDVLQFTMLAVYNIALSRSIFGTNLKTGEKENMVCYNIINAILMIVGLFMIGDCTSLHILVILVTLALFLQNSNNFLSRHQNIIAGIYVGLKFTLLLVVILNSFDVADYVVSSLCILFAVACIVLGFVKEYKSLRIYGLMLSMISVFKLIMVDIHYENTVGNALSFFISGVLCFAISLIYNYVDKKMATEKENSQESNL